MNTTYYYVIETRYVGPNQDQDQYTDVERIEISTIPAVGNESGDVRLDGWCGTTNDWAVYAHGQYDTADDARQAVTDIFGEVRTTDPNGDVFESDEGVIETYRPGKYAPMSSQATADWAYDGIQTDIEADTTDDQIAALIAEYEYEANCQGCTMHSDIEGFMRDRRQELIDEDEA